jgi:hypothetical protein
MPTCSRCGQRIEFRYIDGRPTPLHVDGGGWTCSGHGGSAVKDYSGYQRDSNGCCFLTNCPECRDPVYFIRHNGGSVWIDPPLGWPWYKHRCMDKSSSGPHGARTALGASISIPQNPTGKGLIIGLVREAETSDTKAFTLVNIETGKEISIILLLKNSAGFLVGQLVLYDQVARRVYRFENPEHAFNVIARLRPKPSKILVACPDCGLQFSGVELEEHLRVQHYFFRRPFSSAGRK